RSLIKGFGVNIKGLETKKGKTFRWTGSYKEDMNCAKTLDTQLNVFADFRPLIPKECKNSKYIFLANIDPDLQLHILKCFGDNKFVGCDSMNYWIQNKPGALKKLVKKATFVFLNDAEAKLFSGESNIIKAGRYLLSLGPRFAIIKRGEYGAILFAKDKVLCLTTAYPLENVCDPTGAGDTFAGGFMGYLAKMNRVNNQVVQKALLYGSVMASFAVEDFGVNRFLKLKKQDIEKRYNRFKKLTVV
ncbi:MAG: sugar kinase, partial [Candidatus Omnitrophica bacterium]|nr:sugar kinase [Candidatus Omnitrophota bacterium]